MRRFQERKVVGALFQFDLMLLHQMNAQWTDEFGGVAFACCDVARQLGRVHRFRRGKISIFAQVVNGGQRQQRKDGQDPPDRARPFAHFKPVNPFL